MQVLVLNSGSSSLKFKLLDMPAERELARGMVERIGATRGRTRLIYSGPTGTNEMPATTCTDHVHALGLVMEALGSTPASGYQPPRLIGHRLVHGRDMFAGPTLVDDQVLGQIESIQDLAPLHMPAALAVLRACRGLMPQARHVACFDTSFYLTMPSKSYRYAVPRDWYTRHGVRRYGFHGLSHHYITQCAADMLGIPLDELKLISAHLGNGASITAFDRGRVLDTSMGFTPLEGLIMGTRAGYLDPAVLPYLQRRTGMGADRIVEMLNTCSGLQAISGLDRDLRTIMEARDSGHADAALAVEMYVHTLRKYVGAYYFSLSGAHALVFTGGVGENGAEVRERVLAGLEDVGLILDPKANRKIVGGRAGVVSDSRSRVKILVIPTDEERMIARQAYALCF